MEVRLRTFGYAVAARYLDNSDEVLGELYSHIEAGELGDVATEALDEGAGDPRQRGHRPVSDVLRRVFADFDANRGRQFDSTHY